MRRSIVDLRPSTLARLDATVAMHVLPEWGGVALSGVANADVRAWAARLHADGLSASSVRKAVFALRRILAAAVADRHASAGGSHAEVAVQGLAAESHCLASSAGAASRYPGRRGSRQRVVACNYADGA